MNRSYFSFFKRKKAELIGVYDYCDDAILVEMVVDDCPENISFDNFVVPDKKLDKSSWQVAYMEQFLDPSGTSKICETYEIPKNLTSPTRIAFFLFKTGTRWLQTPYGKFLIGTPQKLPERLASIVDFEPFD